MKTMNEQSEYQLWWEDGVIDGVETLLSVVRKQVPEIEESTLLNIRETAYQLLGLKE